LAYSRLGVCSTSAARPLPVIDTQIAQYISALFLELLASDITQLLPFLQCRIKLRL
jgi:hypothetical protein